MTEQQQPVGERGPRRRPRSAPQDGRSFSRTIECDESVPEEKRTAVVTRGRGGRRGPEENDRPARHD